MKYLISLLLFILSLGAVSAQDYPYDVTQYPFVDYSKARLISGKDSTRMYRIYAKLDSMIMLGKSKLTVVQIGASHTQADIFSNQMRYRLQTLHPGLVGARGFVFPYRMCKSNNPSNYVIKYSGIWQACRNVEWRRACELGISGASATTSDSTASIIISMNPKNPIAYDFNVLKVFTAPHAGMYDIEPIAEMGPYRRDVDLERGCITFTFAGYQQTASMRLRKSADEQKSFTLYGFSLENDNPGVTYHAIGINGASLRSWNACEHFASQLKCLNPDWVVIFLGVNDGNSVNFDPQLFYNEYRQFLQAIQRECPDVVFTMIVPNDYYLLRRRPNPAVALEQEQMLRLSAEFGSSVFSIYDVMGGLGMSNVWVRNGLMAYDKVHMTGTGYNFSANLFFNAFLRSYDYYLENKFHK